MQLSSLALKNHYCLLPRMDWNMVEMLASTMTSDCDTFSRNILTGIACCAFFFLRLYIPADNSHTFFCQRRKNTYVASFRKREFLFSKRDFAYSLALSFTWQGWNWPNAPLENRRGKHSTSRYFWWLLSASSFTESYCTAQHLTLWSISHALCESYMLESQQYLSCLLSLALGLLDC